MIAMRDNGWKVGILAAVFLVVILPSGAAAETTYNLNAGWNMISTNLEGGIDLSTLKSQCQANTQSPPKFGGPEEGEFLVKIRTYSPQEGVTDVETMKQGRGYGVWTDAPCTVTVQGTTVNKVQAGSLSAGWNLVSADTTFNAISQSCNLPNGQQNIWYGEIQEGETQWTHPTQLESTKSYWVYVDSSCTIGETSDQQTGDQNQQGGDQTGTQPSGSGLCEAHPDTDQQTVCPFSDGAVLTADGIEATISVVDDGYIHLDKTEGTAVRVSSDGSKSYMRSNAGEPSIWQSCESVHDQDDPVEAGQKREPVEHRHREDECPDDADFRPGIDAV